MTTRTTHATRLAGAAASHGDAPKRRKAPVVPGRGSEHAEQAAFISLCDFYRGGHPELGLIYAIPNGARTSMSVAVRLKAEGLRSGVPDLHLPVARGSFIGWWCEMKYGRNKPSPEQEWWMDALTEQGHRVVVCYTAEAAMDEALAYLALEGRP